jgi:Fe-S-cluster containining protein
MAWARIGMEITIDFATVRKVMREEYALARAEIDTLGPLAAYVRSQARHDARLGAAPDASTLACAQGCSWCCHFTVDVRAVEVVRILGALRELAPETRARIEREIAANEAVLRSLDDLQRMQRNIKCPFLDAGRCSIYLARPQTCRNYHATDAAGCRRSYEQPENLEIDPEFAALTYQIGGAHVEAFANALRDAGYDVAAYEMNIALAAALAQGCDAVRERFEGRTQPFSDVDGADVPPEFDDED